MAHKKAGSATTNGRDSAGRRLGVKKSGGSRVIPGNVKFKRGLGDRKTVSVIPEDEAK